MWQEQLRLTTQPVVLPTNGSPANVTLLTTGAADVAVSQLDVAADRIAGSSSLRALAAVYNDALQIVVPAGSPIRAVADLRGARVSLGPENSGVAYVAQRVLAAAGLAGPDDVRPSRLDLGARWPPCARATSTRSSGWARCPRPPSRTSPPPCRCACSTSSPCSTRCAPATRSTRPGTVLAGTYRIADPVATLLVRNVLLVDADLDAGLVEALTAALFAEQQRLADATQAARTVDARSAILTQPVPLHDGALRWFSDDAMA